MGPHQKRRVVRVTEPDPDSLEVITEELRARLERQNSSGSRVETKATAIAGFAAVAGQFLATRDANPILAGLAFTAYLISFGAGVWALAVIKYEDVPDPRRLVDEYASKGKAETLAGLAATRVGAFERNAKRHDRKVRWWWVSLAALAVGLVLSGAAIVVHTGVMSGEQGHDGGVPSEAQPVPSPEPQPVPSPPSPPPRSFMDKYYDGALVSPEGRSSI